MKRKKKIIVIYTGGTIGSVKYVTKDGRVIKGQPKDIIKEFPESKDYFSSSTAVTLLCDTFKIKYPFYSSKVEFDNKLELEILSENMSIDRWNELIDCINKYNLDDYDGVIVTHGTDTLGYTSNLLAMLYNNIQVPMFIVSSNDSLDSENANGIYNFKGAIDFILNNGTPGVYVAYTSDNVIDVFYGSRITQCRQIVDKFESIKTDCYSPLGKIDNDGKFVSYDFELMKEIKYDSYDRSLILPTNLNLNANILKINPYVGLNYDNFNIYNCDAILHSCYHSGTSCTIGGIENSVLNLIRSCYRENIDFFYGPIYGYNDKAIYNTTNAVIKAGANIIKNISEENAYVKLLLAYSMYNNLDEIKKYLDSDINHEHIYVRRK